MNISSPEHPLVSVIIPVFNGERYLAEAIDSVLEQDYTKLDIVLVDDGSDDRSAEIAQSYGSKLNYHYQENAGLSAAQNKGVAIAQGDFISFLDCDDLWAPGKITWQLNAFRSEQATDMVFGQVRQFVSPELEGAPDAPATPVNPLLPGYSTGTLLARRAVFAQTGTFSSEFRVGEFLDWYGRATDLGLSSLMLPEILLERRIHKNNMGLRERNRQTDYLRVFKAALERRRRGTDNS